MPVVFNRQGLTYVELVVALGIAGVVVGTAAFGYQSAAQDLRLNQAARVVMLDLTTMRARALAENNGQRLVFTPERNTYQPQRQTSKGYQDLGAAIALPAGIVLSDCTAAGSAVTFRPRGNASTFGTVILRNVLGRERRVIVDIAGRVRVQ